MGCKAMFATCSDVCNNALGCGADDLVVFQVRRERVVKMISVETHFHKGSKRLERYRRIDNKPTNAIQVMCICVCVRPPEWERRAVV